MPREPLKPRPTVEQLQHEILTRRLARRKARLLARPMINWKKIRWWVGRLSDLSADDIDVLGEHEILIDEYVRIKENTEASRAQRWRMLRVQSDKLLQVRKLPPIGIVTEDFRLTPDGRLEMLTLVTEWTPLTGERMVETWRAVGGYIRYEGRTVRTSLIKRALLQPWHLRPDGRLWSDPVQNALDALNPLEQTT